MKKKIVFKGLSGASFGISAELKTETCFLIPCLDFLFKGKQFLAD